MTSKNTKGGGERSKCEERRSKTEERRPAAPTPSRLAGLAVPTAGRPCLRQAGKKRSLLEQLPALTEYRPARGGQALQQ